MTIRHTSRAFLTTLLGAAALLAVASPGSARAATGGRTMTVYAVAASAQFMNHADDRVHGMSANPFNVKTKALVILTEGPEKGNGPFPGDDILYRFKLYADPNLKKSAGSAIFTCYYDFGKHAICDSYFNLNGGVVLASGSVVFNSTHFTMSVSGGTSEYLGVLGEVQATLAAKNAERLHLRLID